MNLIIIFLDLKIKSSSWLEAKLTNKNHQDLIKLRLILHPIIKVKCYIVLLISNSQTIKIIFKILIIFKKIIHRLKIKSPIA
jgi:hypothetical protein